VSRTKNCVLAIPGEAKPSVNRQKFRCWPGVIASLLRSLESQGSSLGLGSNVFTLIFFNLNKNCRTRGRAKFLYIPKPLRQIGITGINMRWERSRDEGKKELWIFQRGNIIDCQITKVWDGNIERYLIKF
jgi:hypothetical protein